MSRTAFALLKTVYSQKYNYVWFYPSQQTLGILPYRPPEVQFQSKREIESASKPAQVKDSLTEVINDLKPKEPTQS